LVLALLGLGDCWRAAASSFHASEAIGEGVTLLAAVIWLALVLAYLAKGIWRRSEALAELHHPTEGCFVALLPTSTMLLALAFLPQAPKAAAAALAIGAAGQLGLAICLGVIYRKDRHPPGHWGEAICQPLTLGCFIAAMAAGAFGAADCGRPLVMAGAALWLIRIAILQPRGAGGAIPDLLRATAGIHCAVPFIGCTAYLSMTDGLPDIVAQTMFAYGVFQGLVLLRLVPRLAAQSVGAPAWTLAFAASSAALAALRLVEHGLIGPFEWVAIALFVFANVATGEIALATAWASMRRGFLTPARYPDRAAAQASTTRQRVQAASGRTVLLLGLAAMFTMQDLFGPDTIAPALTGAFHTTAPQMGFAINAATLGMALAGILTGLFGDRIARKPVMFGALLLLCVPTVLLAAAPNLVVFGLLRVVQGILMCTAFAVTIAYVAEELGPYGAAPFAMAAYLTGNVFGIILARLMSGMIEHLAGWRFAFVALALLNLAGGLVLWRLLPPSKNFSLARHRASLAGALYRHFLNLRLQSANIVGFLILFAYVGTFTYINFRLTSQPFGLNPADLGLLHMVFACSLGVTPFAGLAMKRLGHLAALVVGATICCAGILLTYWDNLPLITLGVALIGAGVPFSQAVTTDFVGSMAQQARAAASGIYLAFYYSGGICGALLLGWVYDKWGWTACVYVTAGAFVAMTGIAVSSWATPTRARAASGLRLAAEVSG
jgi:predicted MFS family arabinose efflux permease/tellurite resistance protein TehA-like permease